MKKALIPLGLFLVLVVFLAIGVTRDPRVVPSPLIGKDAPMFVAPVLHTPEKQFAAQDMRGKVWLLNVWASWCTACLDEHPIMVAFAKNKSLPLVGLNYKDQPANGIKFGVYGVPETFLIDKEGKIRHKQIGPVTEEALLKTILPLARELQK